jgi:hypothetical protein
MYFPLIAVPFFRMRFPKAGVLRRAPRFFRPSLNTFLALAILCKLSNGSRHFLGS